MALFPKILKTGQVKAASDLSNEIACDLKGHDFERVSGGKRCKTCSLFVADIPVRERTENVIHKGGYVIWSEE
jgi:hypothetical protein